MYVCWELKKFKPCSGDSNIALFFMIFLKIVSQIGILCFQLCRNGMQLLYTEKIYSWKITE